VPEVERSRARVYKAVRNSVVHIAAVAFRRAPFTFDLTKVPAGSGTGFVWDDFGHVVTNHHVVTLTNAEGSPLGEAPALEVTLADGKTYKAEIIGRSNSDDIAVLQVFAPLDQLKPVTLGSTKDLEEGHTVLAIGNPFGYDHTLTTGVLSAKGRDIPTIRGVIRGAIQTDAAINPGNSGGPLLDSAGRLVGMNTAIASAGIGFAIPVETLNRVVPVLIRKGRLERPELGFDSLPGRDAAGLGILEGVVVDSVQPESPAGRAGLRGLSLAPGVTTVQKAEDIVVGDVIVGLNGTPVTGSSTFSDLVELTPADKDLELEVIRQGKRIKIVLRIAKPPKATPPSRMEG
jgi:S1-C subfamily serine protease